METTQTSALEELLEALKVGELAEEEQEQLMLELNDLVTQSTLVRMLERMDEESQTEFSALLDGEASEEEVEAFLAQKVPDADAILEDVIRGITKDVLLSGD